MRLLLLLLYLRTLGTQWLLPPLQYDQIYSIYKSLYKSFLTHGWILVNYLIVFIFNMVFIHIQT